MFQTSRGRKLDNKIHGLSRGPFPEFAWSHMMSASPDSKSPSVGVWRGRSLYSAPCRGAGPSARAFWPEESAEGSGCDEDWGSRRGLWRTETGSRAGAACSMRALPRCGTHKSWIHASVASTGLRAKLRTTAARARQPPSDTETARRRRNGAGTLPLCIASRGVSGDKLRPVCDFSGTPNLGFLA